MKKIGLIVSSLMCIMIVSTTAVSAAAPMDEEDVKQTNEEKSNEPCTIGDGSSECTSDCGFEEDETYQEPVSYLIYF
jgi:hypothetical protein